MSTKGGSAVMGKRSEKEGLIGTTASKEGHLNKDNYDLCLQVLGIILRRRG